MPKGFPKACQKLGRYRIEAEIASGGMAVVYLARLIGAAGFSKEFALKKILPQWSRDPEFVRMLVDEAKILTRLKHPNIVEVFELGREGATYYIVMEFVPGMNLRELVKKLTKKKITLPTGLALFITGEVAKALAFAHSQKNDDSRPTPIIHRDISPQNILLSFSGEVKITDFGIAKISGQNQNTQTGQLKGKFAYMSPEQARGENLGPPSDIFALGLILFELVTGKKYFSGQNDLAILEKVRHPKIELPDNLPPDIRSILNRALHPDVKCRYTNALEFKQDLDGLTQKISPSWGSNEFKDFLTGLYENHTSITVVEQAPTLIHAATCLEVPAKNQSHEKQLQENHLPVKNKKSMKYFYTNVILIFCATVLFSTQSLLQTLSSPFSRSMRAQNAILIEPIYLSKLKELHQALAPKDSPSPPLPDSPAQVFTVQIELPEKPQEEFGGLSIIARPWAVVSLDGSRHLETPAYFSKLETGDHRVSVFFPPLKKSISRDIRVAEGQTTKCHASFGRQAHLDCR